MQLFQTGPQPFTKDFTAAKCNQGVRQLIRLTQSIFFRPGIEVGKNPLAAPRAERDHQRKRADQHGGDEEEHLAVDTTQKQDGHGDGGNHHECAHVRLGQQQQPHHADGDTHGRHRAEKALFHIHLANHVVRGVQGDRQLGQFGWLEVHHTQGQPTTGAVHALAHMGNQHQDQQDQRSHEQPRSPTLPDTQWNLGHHGRHTNGQDHREQVAHEKMRGGVVGELGAIGQSNRGRIDHDQADRHQGQHNPDQRLVKAHDGRRLRRDVDVITHRQRTRNRVTIALPAMAQGIHPTGPEGPSGGVAHAISPWSRPN